MDLLEKLKQFVKTNINVDLSNFTFININIGTINKAKKGSQIIPIELDEKSQTLLIDPSKLDKTQYEEFKNIAATYIDNGNYLLEDESSELLDRLYKFNKESHYNKYLNFFQPIIPTEDFRALQSSYFMRKENESNKNAAQLGVFKRQIRNQFGKRGGHIANLCTAGYFEELLIPIHNHNKSSFQDWYNLVVEKEALTLFIHAGLKKGEIISTLKNKTELAKKYGLNSFYVHTKGKRNIKTVHECLKEFEKTYQAIPKVDREISDLDIIIIQFILK
jgi:hypothetical protein